MEGKWRMIHFPFVLGKYRFRLSSINDETIYCFLIIHNNAISLKNSLELIASTS